MWIDNIAWQTEMVDDEEQQYVVVDQGEAGAITLPRNRIERLFAGCETYAQAIARDEERGYGLRAVLDAWNAQGVLN